MIDCTNNKCLTKNQCKKYKSGTNSTFDSCFGFEAKQLSNEQMQELLNNKKASK